VPHFEKMLYDQAQLVTSYLEAYQLTGDDAFADVARDLCDYVLADLTDPETGAFFSAEDADSLIPHKKTEARGESGSATKREGAFYVWTHAELRLLLGDDFPAFAELFGVTEAGNADDPHGELTGTNILHRVQNLGDVARTHGLTPEHLTTRIAQARETLLDARHLRPRPHRDDKILAAWNGMMIGALARADAILDAPAYLVAARRAASFCRDTLWDASARRLQRRYRDGEVAFDAYLGDYAHLAEGFIDLYEATFDLAWLDLAETIVDTMIARFADSHQGGFFTTSGDDPSVLLRLKDDYDGAEPSGNATAALVVVRLATLVGREDLRRHGEAAIRAATPRMIQHPQTLPRMLRAAALAADPPIEIVLTGAHDDP
ncbi:MAG: thioredoxin domain-containing protein, partial [Deltaproteobacteria bacterium]|nr:thioredoxin domain-containing protein [Deltaproteobacteria bacterium]